MNILSSDNLSSRHSPRTVLLLCSKHVRFLTTALVLQRAHKMQNSPQCARAPPYIIGSSREQRIAFFSSYCLIINVSWEESSFLSFLPEQLINKHAQSQMKACSCGKPCDAVVHPSQVDTRSARCTCNIIRIQYWKKKVQNKGCQDYHLNTTLLVERNECRVLNVQNCVELDKQIPCRLC